MTTLKTFSPKPRDIERRWYVVDANGAVLGRLASEIAKVLRGKHKPIFAPHADTGDHVIVVNASGVRLTAGKEDKKIYYRHSGYPGGLREIGYARLLADRPVVAVEKAVRGMLPKNRLGRQMFKKLAVYEGPEHPHSAQKPAPLGIGEVPKWEGLPKPVAPKPPSEAKQEPARGKAAPKKAPKKATSRKSERDKKDEGSAKRPARSGSKTETKKASPKSSAKPSERRGRKEKTEKPTSRRRSRSKES